MATNVKIKIADDSNLRNQLDAEYESASQIRLCEYALLLAAHIMDLTGFDYTENEVIQHGFRVNGQWRQGNARMHDVRQAGFQIHQLAKSSEDMILSTALRVAGQAVATGHMREHAMVASDYAVKVINLLHPNDMNAVKDERLWQIHTLKSVLKREIMKNKALVIIDIQNDITKNYKSVVGNINRAIDWAERNEIHVVYIRHENLSAGTRTFKTDTRGAELVSDLKIASQNVFTKYKGNALSSEGFSAFVAENGIDEFYITGADAVACVKSTCFNLRKAGYTVNVLSDCVTSYDLKKMEEMLQYYEKQGCFVTSLGEVMRGI